ncbi:MAG TPA: ATP-binding cassette domain-containing protein, partial [Phycisphaeraceae bacterium]
QNGSGKTTLARCLSGYLRPTEGRVLSGDGLEISRLTPAQRVRRVGYVFQNPDHQLFRETVWDEVAFGPRNVGMPAELVEQLVGRMLQDLELEDKRHLHPFRLSKGDRQRLAVASIAVLRPAVLIVDEPTTGQDPVKAREIMDLLARLNREDGICVIIISHAMDLVAEYARRTIVMAGGQVLLDGPTREVFGQPEVLARSNVAPPPVSRLALELGLDEIPITIDEARAILQGRWSR